MSKGSRILDQAMKDVKWIGNSHERLRSFPKVARQIVGDALLFAQLGKNIRRQNHFKESVQVYLRSSLVTIRTPTVLFIPSNWERKSM